MNEDTILGILDPYLEDYKQGGNLTHRALYALFDELTTEEWTTVQRILDEEQMNLEEYCTGVLEYELLIDDSQDDGAPLKEVRVNREQDQEEEPDRDQLENEYLMEEELKELLGQVLEELPEDEANVIRMHYGLEGYPKHSLEAIARELELTLDAVMQLEAKGMSHLKDPEVRGQLEDYKNFSK